MHLVWLHCLNVIHSYAQHDTTETIYDYDLVEISIEMRKPTTD